MIMKKDDKKKTVSLAFVAIVAMFSMTYAQNTMFLNEIQNATYVGNHYATEAVGNIVVSHQMIS